MAGGGTRLGARSEGLEVDAHLEHASPLGSHRRELGAQATDWSQLPPLSSPRLSPTLLLISHARLSVSRLEIDA